MKHPAIPAASLCLLGACSAIPLGPAGPVPPAEDAGAPLAQGSLAAQVEIPFTKHVLSNGLRLIVHEDHDAPIIAVNVWYHVGSKDEKPGKTGFAHLFEHLMFQGSENHRGEFFEPLQAAGATGMNGTTNNDRTNYFETVPKNALDLALWLESDRMGHLLGALDQHKLDEQRGVVQNEKRQGENQPYGRSRNLIAAATAPAGHPYSWSVIGSMEDLDAASLEDVHEWFKSSYGAANAVLVVAGDVETEEVIAEVERWFGDIPPGPPIARPEQWVAPLAETKREVMQDRVAQPRITMVWNVAPWGDPSLEHLALFADVLAGGKTSRLYQRLVVREQLATDVRAGVDRRELGSQLTLSATAKPDADLARVEAILDEELARLRDEGPTPDELERARTERLAQFVRGLERIGGFFGKSDQLAEGEVYAGDPAYYKRRIATIERAEAADLCAAAAAATADHGRYVLSVVPFPAFAAAEPAVDRSAPPAVGEVPDATFPPFQRTRLSNGLELLLVERHALPTVELLLVVDCGSAVDPAGRSGLATLTLDLLDEGTSTRTAVEIAEAQERLGARLRTGADADSATLGLSALTTALAPSLELFADVLLHPAFPPADFERIQKEALVRLQASKLEPNAMAARVLPPLLYGAEHPYGALGGGRGTEDSLAALTPEALREFHATWFKPDNARLLVVGDTTLAELVPLLERHLGAWRPGAVPETEIGPAQTIAGPAVYLLDRPGSEQSVIRVALPAPPSGDAQDLALEALNDVLGGTFMSRINLNLREDKGWSYGARSSIADARGPRALVLSAPVQTDRTKESLIELERELEELVGARPGSPEELERVKAQETLSLAGRWETNAAVLQSLAELVTYGYPDDHWSTYAERVRALSVEDLDRAARRLVDPARSVWVVVGDRVRIEDGVRAAGIGEVIAIDADGRPVDGAP